MKEGAALQMSQSTPDPTHLAALQLKRVMAWEFHGEEAPTPYHPSDTWRSSQRFKQAVYTGGPWETNNRSMVVLYGVMATITSRSYDVQVDPTLWVTFTRAYRKSSGEQAVHYDGYRCSHQSLRPYVLQARSPEHGKVPTHAELFQEGTAVRHGAYIRQRDQPGELDQLPIEPTSAEGTYQAKPQPQQQQQNQQAQR